MVVVVGDGGGVGHFGSVAETFKFFQKCTRCLFSIFKKIEKVAQRLCLTHHNAQTVPKLVKYAIQFARIYSTAHGNLFWLPKRDEQNMSLERFDSALGSSAECVLLVQRAA